MSPLILFYSILKIGCFCAGCCYGIPYNGIGHITLNNNNILPLQIIESIYNMILFACIIILQKNNDDNRIICKGILLFEIGKFAFAFLRNSKDEPIFLGITLSQYILLILIIITFKLFKKEAEYSKKFYNKRLRTLKKKE